MKKGIDVIVVGNGFEQSTIVNHLQDISKDAEVIVVDDKKSLSEIAKGAQAIPIYNYRRSPYIETIDEGKKRTKPCTRHEYVEGSKEEVSPNIFKSQWICRHCNKKL